ncbi:hypothetical protein K8R33_00735 [archaeon]|nr:hypothetical protein [archaeon]
MGISELFSKDKGERATQAKNFKRKVIGGWLRQSKKLSYDSLANAFLGEDLVGSIQDAYSAVNSINENGFRSRVYYDGKALEFTRVEDRMGVIKYKIEVLYGGTGISFAHATN